MATIFCRFAGIAFGGAVFAAIDFVVIVMFYFAIGTVVVLG